MPGTIARTRAVILSDLLTTPPALAADQRACDDLYVIHVMPLRAKYRSQYEDAKKWRI